MERLSDRAIDIVNELHRERLDYNSEYVPLIDALQKLSAYEDTGLEPGEHEYGLDSTVRWLAKNVSCDKCPANDWVCGYCTACQERMRKYIKSIIYG